MVVLVFKGAPFKGKPSFVGMYRGIIIAGFPWWCRILSIHVTTAPAAVGRRSMLCQLRSACASLMSTCTSLQLPSLAVSDVSKLAGSLCRTL